MPVKLEVALMQSIREKYHAIIEAICGAPILISGALPAVPPGVKPEFLAALIAGESGGNPDAKRFEGGVLVSLWQVLQGRKAHFGSIGAQDLRLHLLSGETPHVVGGVPAEVDSALGRLDELATSWGLTQIMGYESIAFGVPVPSLMSPVSGLQITCRMLAQFAQRKQLDLGKSFPELFDCWNTGRPHAPTADPAYIPRGLARLDLYRELLEEPGAVEPGAAQSA